MARTKKEAALTPEERLQAALVPDWEWPYKLPDNWCWTYLGQISEILNGYAFKSQQYCGTGIRIIRITNVQDGYIEDEKPVFYPIEFTQKLEQFLLNEGDLLMSLTGNVGRVAILTRDYLPAALNQRVGCIRTQNDYVIKKYLFYYFLQKKFQDSCVKNAKGSAQLNMSTEWLKIQEIALPPLVEQQRIVDRIESLFAKLDEAKEKAQTVVDSFETRKAAILHKAFTGELTAKWREEHGVGMESWEKHTVDDLCHSLKYGTAKKSDASGKVVVIRMGNLQQGEIDWSDLAYSNDDDDIEKYKLYPDDVLFNRTNSAALVGKTSIYRGEYPAIYAGYLIKLDYDHEQIIGDYLNYALNTLDAKEYCNSVKTDGVNQSNINAKKIGAYSFNVPSVPEQKEVVGTVQRLLLKEKQAKEAAKAVLDQIDLMKKSILARAFRGELGTNDPADEPAVELLKKVLDIPAEPKPKAKRKFIPKELDTQIKTDLERKIIKAFMQNETGVLPIKQLMGVSSKKFDIMEALRNLQNRGILLKENDTYKLMG